MTDEPYQPEDPQGARNTDGGGIGQLGEALDGLQLGADRKSPPVRHAESVVGRREFVASGSRQMQG